MTRIRHARLIRIVDDGQIVAENSFDRDAAPSPSVTFIDATTQAYSISELGSPLYFTGENAATLIPSAGLQPERLQVQIGIYSQETRCRGYGLLARAQLSADNAVTDSPGRRTLVLNFTGKGISEPGPYHIEQVGTCRSYYSRLRQCLPGTMSPSKYCTCAYTPIRNARMASRRNSSTRAVS
jgi:hypothetical protein